MGNEEWVRVRELFRTFIRLGLVFDFMCVVRIDEFRFEDVIVMEVKTREQ